MPRLAVTLRSKGLTMSSPNHESVNTTVKPRACCAVWKVTVCEGTQRSLALPRVHGKMQGSVGLSSRWTHKVQPEFRWRNQSQGNRLFCLAALRRGIGTHGMGDAPFQVSFCPLCISEPVPRSAFPFTVAVAPPCHPPE